jgi:hypothetical protein
MVIYYNMLKIKHMKYVYKQYNKMVVFYNMLKTKHMKYVYKQ